MELDPSRSFKFGIEDRISCPSGKVVYNKRLDYILSLNIPLNEATNKGTGCYDQFYVVGYLLMFFGNSASRGATSFSEIQGRKSFPGEGNVRFFFSAP